MGDSTLKRAGRWLGPGLLVAMLVAPIPDGLSREGWCAFAVAGWMAVWWITEAVPLAVTSLLPVVALPLLGAVDVKTAGTGYGAPAIFLTLGGFMIGIAIERWQLHKRIAMNTVKVVGTQPSRVIGGFMIATALLSMWITNTGTTVMMLPIAVSVVVLLRDQTPGQDAAKQNFGRGLMLGLAYSATIGGMSTLVGTSTNALFKGYFEETYGYEIGFTTWLSIAGPISLVMLFITWWWVTRVMYPAELDDPGGEIPKVIDNELRQLGTTSPAEARTLTVFAATATLWIFGEPLSALTGLDLDVASVAILGATLLFVVPAGGQEQGFLLTWEDARRVPWGILLLLGGGLSIAKALKETGVAEWLGAQMQALDTVPLWVGAVVVTLVVLSLSELMSNVATLSAFLPVITSLAIGLGHNPLTLAVPAAFAASCAFMLPVATPPNAIVFGSRLVTIPDMVKAGTWINLLGLVVVNIACALLLAWVFGVTPNTIPTWAQGAP